MVKVQDYKDFLISFISPLVSSFKSKVQDELANNETKKWYLKLSRSGVCSLYRQLNVFNTEQTLITLELKRCEYCEANTLEFIVPDDNFKAGFYNWWSKGKPYN